ncbi:alpha-L-arabinofuranosidase [Ferruginibacter sp. SUN106]|uniref:alpha-L-arabinofuranosidase n=1 Tax=Ferruginibacter sp. SUN106 TaxID=2978348 RepID=UPI003D3612F9
MKQTIFAAASFLVINLFACGGKPDTSGGGGTGGGGTGGGGTVTPTDPATANTIGFFMNDWQSKTFTAPSYNDVAKPVATATSLVTIDAGTIVTKVVPSVYAHNANSWMGDMINDPALINHITNLKPGIIRFPGGSISDIYFWNALPGTAPADAPAQLLDANGTANAANYWVGKNTANWTISLDKYYSMLAQTGNQGMITVNYAYARYSTATNPVASAAHLAADWVRYDNGRTKYWEIGNECNGTWEASYRINTANNKDGQPAIITGALYGQHVKVFIDSMRKAATEIGKTIYIGSYILEAQPAAWQTATDQTWNAGVLAQVNTATDYYIIHSYYTPYQTNATATEILNTATDNTTSMLNFYQNGLTAAGNTIKPVALTEYNITSQGSKQQVSFVNGMHATILLGEAIKNKYGMSARWDLSNGYNGGNDHGLFNAGDEPGVAKWNPRPAFYYMYYFQKYMGDRMLKSTVTGGVLAYASSFSSGEKAVVLVNKSTSAETVNITLQNATAGARYYWYTLTGGNDNGEFSPSVFVNGNGPTEPTGGPSATYTTIKASSAATGGGINVSMPARSVVYLAIDK